MTARAAKIKKTLLHSRIIRILVKYLSVYSYQNCLETQIGLGLDLKGGMNVILEISVPDVIGKPCRHKTDAGFTNTMKEARAQEEANGGDFVSLFNRLSQERTWSINSQKRSLPSSCRAGFSLRATMQR